MIMDFSSLIGNTPLIRLKKLSELSGCEILGKAEFLNPGSSVKDRAALFIINEAILSGDLKPGGTIVEGTAGNTGIGLTLIGASMGFSTVIVIPETQTKEKKDALKNSGAQLIEVPAVPYSNKNNYIKYSERLARELNAKLPQGAFWANQFDNLANRKAHINTTAPEIYEQTSGKVDAFICSVGTGGTLSGVSEGLRALQPISEGIGQGRITENLKGLYVDASFRVSDHDALNSIYDLFYEEGLSVGISAGINMVGAFKLAQTLDKGSTIVTILCDHGMRYQSKIFNREFLIEMGLPLPFWMKNSSEAMPDVTL